MIKQRVAVSTARFIGSTALLALAVFATSCAGAPKPPASPASTRPAASMTPAQRRLQGLEQASALLKKGQNDAAA